MKYICSLFVIVFAFIISCPQTKYQEESNNNSIASGTSLDVTTDYWKVDTSHDVQFYTNDKSYLAPNGSTFWAWGNLTENPMNSIESNLVKISGKADYGYGLIFCMQDANNFLCLMVDINGWYVIGKVVDKKFKYIQDWTSNSYLNTGYNISNKIKITYNSGNSTFTLFINGHNIQDFKDNIDPAFTGGKYGFIVTLASNEEFPNKPVDVRFMDTTPDIIN